MQSRSCESALLARHGCLLLRDPRARLCARVKLERLRWLIQLKQHVRCTQAEGRMVGPEGVRLQEAGEGAARVARTVGVVPLFIQRQRLSVERRRQASLVVRPHCGHSSFRRGLSARVLPDGTLYYSCVEVRVEVGHEPIGLKPTAYLKSRY